jgi:hypothetical protein
MTFNDLHCFSKVIEVRCHDIKICYSPYYYHYFQKHNAKLQFYFTGTNSSLK